MRENSTGGTSHVIRRIELANKEDGFDGFMLVNDFIARLLELILLLFVEKTQSSISYMARSRTKIQHTYVIRSPGHQVHPFKISIRAPQH
jgi:hypothetical protein